MRPFGLHVNAASSANNRTTAARARVTPQHDHQEAGWHLMQPALRGQWCHRRNYRRQSTTSASMFRACKTHIIMSRTLDVKDGGSSTATRIGRWSRTSSGPGQDCHEHRRPPRPREVHTSSSLGSATTFHRVVRRRSPAGRRWAKTLLSGLARQGSHEAHRFADETLGGNAHFIDVVIFKKIRTTL